MIETIVANVAAFIGTNIDDIIVDTILFADIKSRRQFYAGIFGKYLGIGLLVLFSLFGAILARGIPEGYIRFLGLIPIGLGIREWIEYRSAQDDDADEMEKADSAKAFFLKIALITIANGADNVGVYIPLFAGYDCEEMISMLGTFAVLILFWCLLAKRLSDLPVLNRFIANHKRKIIPVVFVALGLYILLNG